MKLIHTSAIARRCVLALSTMAIAACADAPAPVSPQSSLSPSAAPLTMSSGIPVPGRYIVVLKNDIVSASSVDVMASEHPGEVLHRYHSALNGMAVTLDPGRLAHMRADPRVAYVEQDEVVTATGVQGNAPWGLDRLDQRALPLGGTYVYGGDGTGVTAYIIDTGINFSHTEYAGRAFTGVDEITVGGTGADCFGHGTGVAGVVGGTTYGVAKNVRLVSVRVLDCSGQGTKSSIIAGVDWVTANRTLPAVANMSIGGSVSAAENQAIQNSMAAGVTYVVAAGNSAVDACTASPASAPGVITVGATSSTDAFATFSDFGSCVAINAPGVGITTSALSANNSATSTGTGTSYSSPHVAGAAALYLQAHPGATPAQVRAALTSNATANVLSGVPAGTPNLLIYTGFIGSVAPSPTASFTSSCPSLSCSFDASGSTALSSATFTWTFGDGATATGKTPTHVYASAGSYSVTLSVSDTNGTGSKTSSVNPVSSSAAPIARFTWSCPTLQCSMDASTSTATGGVVTYAWNWGNGRSESRSTPTTRNTWATAGIYTVTLTITDASGRTSTLAQQVPVPTQTAPAPNQAPTATISAPSNAASFVQGTSVSFAGTGNDAEDGALSGASLAWTSSINGTIGTGTGFTTTALAVGTHTITLTAKDTQGATGSASRTITVTAPVNQSPVPRFSWSCVAGTHQCSFDASASTASAAISSYGWSWGDGRVETHTSPLARNTWSATATYSVTLTITDANGRSASVTNPVPVP